MLVRLHRNQQAFQKSISEYNTQKNSSLTSKKDQMYEFGMLTVLSIIINAGT